MKAFEIEIRGSRFNRMPGNRIHRLAGEEGFVSVEEIDGVEFPGPGLFGYGIDVGFGHGQ